APLRLPKAGHPTRAPFVDGDAGDELERVDIVRAVDAHETARAEGVGKIFRERVGKDVETAPVALREVGRIAVEPERYLGGAARAFEDVSRLTVDGCVVLN